jgi:DNA-binding NtrC family response regulator
MASILHVHDEPAIGRVLQDTLERAGHHAVGAHDVPGALQALSRGGIDLIIAEYLMPGLTGPEFLNVLSRNGCEIPVIMLTGDGELDHAVASIKAGAIDYLTKPLRPQQLELAVAQALQLLALRRENESLRREVIEFRNERQIVGDSTAIRRILQTVAMAAPTRASVLLQGERGTGKSLFARAIHDQSDRRTGPFIQLDCEALPEGLVESALFGREHGTSTVAGDRVDGAIERAHRGTLVLHGVSGMPPELQAKLWRALEEQVFERVGGTSPIPMDVRIIAATNGDLAAEAAAGTFRRDLYVRLSVIPIPIPPLRERKEDIAPLAIRFAVRAGQAMGKEVRGMSAEAIEFLSQQEWVGNVPELRGAVERAVTRSAGPVIELHAFDSAPPAPARAVPRERAARPASGSAEVTLTTFNVVEAERALITRALEAADGNRTRAADLLGMSVRTLRNKLNNPSDPDAGEDDLPS